MPKQLHTRIAYSPCVELETGLSQHKKTLSGKEEIVPHTRQEKYEVDVYHSSGCMLSKHLQNEATQSEGLAIATVPLRHRAPLAAAAAGSFSAREGVQLIDVLQHIRVRRHDRTAAETPVATPTLLTPLL